MSWLCDVALLFSVTRTILNIFYFNTRLESVLAARCVGTGQPALAAIRTRRLEPIAFDLARSTAQARPGHAALSMYNGLPGGFAALFVQSGYRQFRGHSTAGSLEVRIRHGCSARWRHWTIALWQTERSDRGVAA